MIEAEINCYGLVTNCCKPVNNSKRFVKVSSKYLTGYPTLWYNVCVGDGRPRMRLRRYETMKYTVVSATYGPMKTFDNEHDAESAMNTYNWTTENDRAYIEKEEETMTLFEIIKATTATATEETVESIAAQILDQYGENVTEEQAIEATKSIMKEEATMKTTNITLNLTEGAAKFTKLDGTTYTYHIDSKRYAKTTADGKTKRIGKAEYDAAKHEYDLEQEVENLELHPVDEQAELDKEPCRVEVENDLEKPAVLNENGLVDCSKCNCDKCVHRNCMRRNPRNVGGLGECPRLDNGIMGEGQKISEEEGIELADAELEANIRNEQKKPTRKPRKSKDIAYEGNGVTLTAKQVDFLGHLSDTDFWENGADSTAWVDVLCDQIGGQFADKPMTVGAMVSTLCEKGLGYRGVEKMTDMVTGRSHKSTYFGLTDLGQKIYAELGLE